MVESLFITGSSGFIGRRLLQTIDSSKYRKIFCLTRKIDVENGNSRTNGNIEHIQGDLNRTDRYDSYLTQCDTVVHLAAATGKVDIDEYFLVNTKGTELFIQQCKRAGVKNFLYVSTIAVNYPDITAYYYAQSKQMAEAAVRGSGLDYVIVRPTIVIGIDSNIWNSLSKLARTPIIPLFGDGFNKVQPIYVDDLVSCLVAILHENLFQNETIDLGGPQQVTLGEFLSQIHYTSFQKRPKLFRLPITPVTKILSVLGDRAQSRMPITVGQLSAFKYDSTVQTNGFLGTRTAKMKDVPDMIAAVVQKEALRAEGTKLERECETFCRHLIGASATAYVQEKYRQAHLSTNLFAGHEATPFGLFLLKVATRHPVLADLVDAYTSIFMKRAIVRKKMILLLAILECSAPNYAFFDRPDAQSLITIGFKLFARGVAFSASLLLALLIFTPIRMALVLKSSSVAGAENYG